MKITIFHGDVSCLGVELVCEPFWGTGSETELLVTTAHRDTLALADSMGLDTVAFRCFPADDFGSHQQEAAVATAIDIIRSFTSDSVQEVFFWSPRRRDLAVYLRLLGANNALNGFRD